MIKTDVTSKAYNEWIAHIMELVQETNFFVIKENTRTETSTQLSVYFPENEHFGGLEPFMLCSEYCDNIINVRQICERSEFPRFLGGDPHFKRYFQSTSFEMNLRGTDDEFRTFLQNQIKYFKEAVQYFKNEDFMKDFKNTNTWKKQIEGTYNAV